VQEAPAGDASAAQKIGPSRIFGQRRAKRRSGARPSRRPVLPGRASAVPRQTAQGSRAADQPATCAGLGPDGGQDARDRRMMNDVVRRIEKGAAADAERGDDCPFTGKDALRFFVAGGTEPDRAIGSKGCN